MLPPYDNSKPFGGRNSPGGYDKLAQKQFDAGNYSAAAELWCDAADVSLGRGRAARYLARAAAATLGRIV